MEDRRVADYFVVAGLPKCPEPLEDFSWEGINLKSTHNQAPITDVAVIFRSLGEMPPQGFNVIDTTVSGLCADLNHGSIRSPNVFLCYKRGRDKPPIVDIGVLYEGKDRLMADSEVVLSTPQGRPANVNNSGSKTFITFRRASDTAPCNELVVTDICVILSNKGENPPHTFCIIPKNLNKGMVGSDVYLCYKKTMNRSDSIAYKPAILDRFPTHDYEDFPLPLSVPLFCIPMGATIDCWPAKASSPKPVFSTFVLTSQTGEKVYGAAVSFYERYNKPLTAEQKQLLPFDEQRDKETKTVNVNKSICILSHWPFFDTFEKFLFYLHGMVFTGPHSIPIERYISHFMTEIPFPSPQRPRILIQLTNNDRMSLAQPEDLPLPLSGASFQQLLKNLSPDNCLLLLLFALTEQKLLLHSLRPDVLTSVAEAVSMLIFPFHWQCPYIPLCPLGLSDVLSAPMAFIVGIDSRYFDLYDPPNDVTWVDLDTNTISISEERKTVTVKLLPKKPSRVLRNSLISLCERMKDLSFRAKQMNLNSSLIDRDFKLKKEERMIELEIQEAFLRFTASVLKGYRSFLQPITKAPTIGTTDCSSLFDIQGFLKSRDKAYQRFYMLLTKTQMFTRFIEERSFVSDKDVSLAFFDDCIEKVDTGEFPESRLLEIEESQQSERTVFVTPPEPFGLPPNATYSYSGFKNLNPKLYHEKQQIKTWVSPIAKSSPAPGSPLAKRTKQEIKTAQQSAKRHSEKPVLWSKCLVSYCYTLWFIHLPAYVKSCQSKTKALQIAYDILVKMQSARLHPPDEVCYRVLMQLCGQYSQPVLAVKLLSEMKRNGVHPNAITYGYYNKAVLESTWPSSTSNGYLLWNKLRNVIIGVALFKRGSNRRPISMYSESDYDGVSRGSTEGSAADVSLPAPSEIDAKPEDGTSTGCQSDVGYNSMNTDETQKSSSSISSQLTANDGENGASSAESRQNVKQPAKEFAGNKGKRVKRTLKFDDVDFTESDQLRNQLRTIVKSSVTTLTSVNGLCNDIVDSSAGTLITGRTSICEDDVFDDGVGFKWRRRHRSASDFGQDQHQHRQRIRHASGSDHKSLSRQMSRRQEIDQEILRSDSFGNDATIINKLNVSNNSLTNDDQNVTSYSQQPSVNKDEDQEVETERVTMTRKPSVYEGPRELIREDVAWEDESETLSPPNVVNGSWFDFDMLRRSLRRGTGFVYDRGPNKVTRSATFCHSPEHTSKLNAADEAAEQTKRFIHRSSSVLPESQSTSQLQMRSLRSTSASSLMSPTLTSIKMAFNQSPRRSDLISSLKSAANSMATKLSEIKEAISQTGTPTKTLSERKSSYDEESSVSSDQQVNHRSNVDLLSRTLSQNQSQDLSTDELDAMMNEAEQVRSLSLGIRSNHLASVQDINSSGEKLCNSLPVAMEILMTSCSRCHTCGAMLYDEEIMIGWTGEDSNLNTRCQFCSNKLVPFLLVTIKDHRVSNDKLSHSNDSLTRLDTLPDSSNSPTISPQKSTSVDSSTALSTETEVDSCFGLGKADNIVRQPARTLYAVPELTEENVENNINNNNNNNTNNQNNLLGSLSSSRASSVADVTTRGNLTRGSFSSFLSLEPISVPYLSPIVLRKEMENVLEHEGDACLTEDVFVDLHPIIYWNLMWFFERIGVPSHISGLCLSAQSVNRGREIPSSWCYADSSNVSVRCMWDNVKLHEENVGQPMYMLWEQNASPSHLVHALLTEPKSVTKEVMNKIINDVTHNDLVEPLKLVLNHIQKRHSISPNKQRRYSVYRDLLFLIITALGRENIRLSSFEREYRRAYDSLPPIFAETCQKFDSPPSVGAVLCRQPFKGLEL